MKTILPLLLVPFLLMAPAQADMRLHSLFTNDMILQRDKPVPVWGTADPGEKITVRIGNQRKKTTAGPDGSWLVRLAPMKVATGETLTVTGKNSITLTNIAIGDVYLCSGQSNMEEELRSVTNGEAEAAASIYPNIRLFKLAPHPELQPQMQLQPDPGRKWQTSTRTTARSFSAVGYIFGRELHKQTGIPIGLISAAQGATIAESWTSRATLETLPGSRQWLHDFDSGAPITKNPAYVGPSVLFNGTIAPLAPFAMRGVAWYQGESNGNAGTGMQYRVLFPAMIENWRSYFGQKDLGFYYVQIANYMAHDAEPRDSDWTLLREAQALSLSTPRTGMATIIDMGDVNEIHPRDKVTIGERLALPALAKEYGQEIEYSGPTLKSLSIKNGKAYLKFTHAAGLTTKDGKAPSGFAICGPDKKFVWANTRLERTTVVVWHDSIPHPTAVRYAWGNNPKTNLYNAANLPAVPFRTDVPPTPEELLPIPGKS